MKEYQVGSLHKAYMRLIWDSSVRRISKKIYPPVDSSEDACLIGMIRLQLGFLHALLGFYPNINSEASNIDPVYGSIRSARKFDSTRG